MVEKQSSWDEHASRLKERGWAQSRHEISPIEAQLVTSSSAREQADLFRCDSGDHDPGLRPDALDMVFETIEGYICGHDAPRALQGEQTIEFADRGQVRESVSEVWSLQKLGEVQQRGSVADRIKAFESSSVSAPSTPTPNIDRPAMRRQAEPTSTSPVSRWTKQTGASPESPKSWARPQMEKSPGSPGSPNSWTRPPMEKTHASPGSPRSWIKPTMEKSPATPRSDVARSSAKVPVPPRQATSAHGTKSEKKQPIPAWPTKLKNIPRKPAHPDAIVARILKDSKKESSGLSFVSYFEKEGIYVSKIRDTSKFKNTFLKPGMKVLRINGVPCPGRVKNVIKMLKAAKRVIDIEAIRDDSIAFVAREQQATANEETHAKKNGSSVEPSKERAVESRETQNHDACTEDDMGFTDLLMLSMGYVAQKPQEEMRPIERKDSSASIASLDRSEIPEKPKNKKVHAMVFKKTRKDKIGISFVSFKKKRGVYVYEMYEDSKFQRTGLEVGMKVLSINRQPCPERVSETLAMVKDIQGHLVITAVAPSDENTGTGEAQGGALKSRNEATQPKVHSLQKLGRDQRRIAREEPEVSEGQILNKRERREVLGDFSWIDDKQSEEAEEEADDFSQDSQTTTSVEEDDIDDDGSFISRWGSSLAESIFGI
ncbi:unnamed protein product [Cylindrotheca closterium]|uniref:PDZ domain-containing protein n=1 Tax=Cylindrotheca closterium TaxID=2856 RepID=A0AAD2CKF4_9STRA|nr:unnamed protein product [Cylindrotheca closterium]